MLQQPENGDIQPNTSPSLQQNRDNMPNSSSNEAINGLPSDLGGSSGHQPRSSEAQIAATEFTICCQWGIVLKLLELLSPESIAMQDAVGNTVLHYVAKAGSIKAAKALLRKKADLPQLENNEGNLPLHDSISSESKEMVWYLTLITRVESPVFPFFKPSLPKILHDLIQSGYHDIALYFVRKYPNLALTKDESGTSLLWWLACEPSHFFSRTCIKKVREVKLRHECAVELVNHVCTRLSGMTFQQIFHFLRNPQPIMSIAVEGGVEEIVWTLLQHFPDLIFYNSIPQRNILQVAIQFRQKKIINIIKEISPAATMTMCMHLIESENTTLHLVGKLAPAFKLYSVSGAD
ncbi:hypothetical protein Ddye_013585 [Dipteronia dyeriana]|uniref:Uncharacterized protein n=1 Tax=Dipteronia dyeriana TaxID=168575 RepID=A0AAD9X6N3_9ROSI|nr:hypothetical protein Ddye_013585 [Dipteronia dyeriana]